MIFFGKYERFEGSAPGVDARKSKPDPEHLIGMNQLWTQSRQEHAGDATYHFTDTFSI